jgi:L-alanine-DL-glutamate epimerase-like enolase superfamily enzyme
MKISKVEAHKVLYQSIMERDAEGHAHPGKAHDATIGLLTVTCDDGTEGYAVSGKMVHDIINNVAGPALIGEDPFFHERIWQRMRTWQRLHTSFSDHTLCALDTALWDICGKICGQPVYRLLGAYRDKVPAYGSIMVGDDLPGGLDTPQAYADFAVKLVKRGYKAIKLHTWMPPIIPEPDPKLDVKACAAVREAVGPDIELMLDPYHDYSRQQALYLAKELEKLNFLWLEEPMDESSMSSYKWLSDQADILICGPETMDGKNKTRAEWIRANAADIGRAGVEDNGGITNVIKTVHLYESFGMSVELHDSRIGNLHVLGSMGIEGKYYERGLLHPMIDYEKPMPWLKSIYDPMDTNGLVTIPPQSGLGWDLNWDYINDNLV